MPPVVFLFLWCCGVTVGVIISVKSLLGGRIPEWFMPRHWSDKSSDDAQRKAKLQMVPVGLIFLFAIMNFIYQGIAMLDTGNRHDLLTDNWHGLALHNVLGATAMLLGIGMLRVAFLRHLSQIVTRLVTCFFVKTRNHPSPTEQDVTLTARAALIVLGLFVTEAGILLYYFVTPVQ